MLYEELKGKHKYKVSPWQTPPPGQSTAQSLGLQASSGQAPGRLSLTSVCVKTCCGSPPHPKHLAFKGRPSLHPNYHGSLLTCLPQQTLAPHTISQHMNPLIHTPIWITGVLAKCRSEASSMQLYPIRITQLMLSSPLGFSLKTIPSESIPDPPEPGWCPVYTALQLAIYLPLCLPDWALRAATLIPSSVFQHPLQCLEDSRQIKGRVGGGGKEGREAASFPGGGG